jgi:hypothetical protein
VTTSPQVESVPQVHPSDTSLARGDNERSPPEGSYPPSTSANTHSFGPPGYGPSSPPSYGQSIPSGSPRPAPKRRLGTGAIVAIVIGAVLARCLVLGTVIALVSPAGDNGTANSPQPAASIQATSEPTTTPPSATTAPAASVAAPPAVSATFGEGTYEVGVEIAPGQYKSAGASDSAFMFSSWSTKDGSGKLLDFGTANGATEQQIVTLKQGQVFDSSGCKAWTKTK